MKRPLNILIFSPHDLPNSHISRNFDYAKRMVQYGHNVFVLVNNYSHRDGVRMQETGINYFAISDHQGVKVVWLDTYEYQKSKLKRGINSISYLYQSLRYVFNHAGKLDVCVGDSVPPTAGLAAYLASLIKKAKFVYQIRDVWPEELVCLGVIKRYGPVYLALRALEIFLYNRADRIFSALPLVARHVLKSGGAIDKIVYIPNGVDLNVFSYYPPRADFSHPLKLVYAGGFGNAHDVEAIVIAVNLCRADGISVNLDAYGDGVKLKKCKVLCQQLKLTNVRFMGSVDKSTLSDAYGEADALIAAVVNSDTYQFGVNSNKIYDYMAAGRPIVFGIKAPTTPIDDVCSGFVVAPEDPAKMAEAIRKLCNMPRRERELMGLRLRQTVEHRYDVDKLGLVFEKSLQELVSE